MIDTNNDAVNLQSDTRFQIFDNLQDGVTVYEIMRDALNDVTNLRVKYINNTAINNEILSCEKVVGKTIVGLYDDEISFLHLKMANDILKSGKGKKFKTYFKSLGKYYSVSTYLSDNNTLITISTDITEKEKMEEKLQKQADLLDLTRDAIIVRDMGDRIIFWNHGAEERYGWMREDAYGKVAHNLLKTEFSEPLTGIFNQLFRKGHWEGEVTHARRDGEKIVVLSRWELQKNENKEPTGYMEINTDITGRKKVEKALKEFGASQSKIANELEQARNNLEKQVKERTAELEEAYNALKESEEKFRGIFSGANDMITLNLINENGTPGRFIEINEVGIKRLGYSKEELLSMSLSDIIVQDNADKMLPKALKRFNENYQFELVELTKDLKRIPVDVSIQFIDYGEIKACLAISRDITERKRAENALQFQADILKNVRDAVIVYNLQGKIIYWNKGAELVYGYSKEEINGKNIKILYLDRNIGKFAEDMEELIELGEYTGEWEGKRKDGSKLSVDIRETVMQDMKGNIIGIIGVSKDITERKKAEKALNDSEKQLRMITDNMVDMVSQTDINGVIQYVSPSGKILLGYEPEELIGTSIFDYVHPDNLEEVKAAFKKAFYIMEPDKLEVKFRHADGHYPLLEIAGNLLFDENHLIKGAVFGSRDISERKKAEKQIKRQYSVLNGINRIFRESLTSETAEEVAKIGLNVAEQLTDSGIGFIAEINDDRQLCGISVSSSAWKLYKAPPSEISKLITNMKFSSYLEKIIKKEKSQIINVPDSAHDRKGLPEGHPPINPFLCVPLKQGDKTIGLIALANKVENYTLEDVENIESLSIAIVEALVGFKSKNKLKKYKNRLEETVGDLKRSNEELQRFAYVASHDLQEPLRTIASFTQLLERRYKGKLDADADEFMNYTVEAALRMKEQIKGLLEYSRISTKENEFKDVSSKFILNQAISNLQFAINENKAEITYDSMPVIMCDAGQLQRIFQNLISNAIKFKKENERPKIHISAKKDNENQEYIFSVLDNGIGIEKQYMDRIFVIFQRLHTIEEYNGTGIGLSIVKKIIERHGGRIWVKSSFGKGSIFYFTVPYSR